MKQLNFKVKNPVNVWTNKDSFVNGNVPQPPAGSDTVVKNNGVIDAVIDVAKKTKDMLIDESKTIAPDVVDTLKDSQKRLDSDYRIINAIPNSYLYCGIIGLVSFIVVKKLL